MTCLQLSQALQTLLRVKEMRFAAPLSPDGGLSSSRRCFFAGAWDDADAIPVGTFMFISCRPWYYTYQDTLEAVEGG